jgi:uncharacterized protein YqjF (DUF2071 family)
MSHGDRGGVDDPDDPDQLPWIFAQTYEHLLLVHWPVPAERLRPVVPAAMNLVTFEGAVWLGHDVYLGTHARMRLLPPIPGFDTRPVVTLRTIVDVGGVRGIFLISVDAPGTIPGLFERHFLNVRTHAADVSVVAQGAGATVEARRDDDGAVELRGSYRPSGPPAPPAPGSREHFLLGGDRVFTADAGGRIDVIEVRHGKWALAPAQIAFDVNTIPRAAGLPGPERDVVAVTQRAQQAYAAAPRPI